MDDKLREEINRRRTFAIISHPDAGKTTLTEKFLLFGVIPFPCCNMNNHPPSLPLILQKNAVIMSISCLQ